MIDDLLTVLSDTKKDISDSDSLIKLFYHYDVMAEELKKPRHKGDSLVMGISSCELPCDMTLKIHRDSYPLAREIYQDAISISLLRETRCAANIVLALMICNRNLDYWVIASTKLIGANFRETIVAEQNEEERIKYRKGLISTKSVLKANFSFEGDDERDYFVPKGTYNPILTDFNKIKRK